MLPNPPKLPLYADKYASHTNVSLYARKLNIRVILYHK